MPPFRIYSVTKWALPPTSDSGSSSEKGQKKGCEQMWDHASQYVKSNIQLVSFMFIVISINGIMFVYQFINFSNYKNVDGTPAYIYMLSR